MEQNRNLFPSNDENKTIGSQKGNNHLLAIGIDIYQDPTIDNLRNAERDAKKFTQVLSDRYEFEEKHIHPLFNEEATRENIIGKLDELERVVGKEDSLLVYYSGHGYFREKGKRGYLVPSDANVKDQKYASLIENSTILNYGRSIEARHILLILDSCYSGSMVSPYRDVQPNLDAQAISTLASRVGNKQSRMGLTSGQIEKVSDGFGEHSPFTETLIKVLDSNPHAHFPGSVLFQTVKLSTVSKADQTPRSGVLNVGDESLNKGGEFIFQLRPDESEDWDKARKEKKQSGFHAYLTKYPEGKYREEAHWEIALLQDSIAGYRNFRKNNNDKNGKYYQQAKEKQSFVSERNLYNDKLSLAKRTGDELHLESYLETYDTPIFEEEAKAEIARIVSGEPEVVQTETKAEQKRKEEVAKEEQEAEQKRIEEVARKEQEAEQKHIEEAASKKKEAEQKRIEETARKKKEAEQKRIEETARKKKVAEQKRKEEAARKKQEAEQKRIEETARKEQEAEQKRIEEAASKKKETEQTLIEEAERKNKKIWQMIEGIARNKELKAEQKGKEKAARRKKKPQKDKPTKLHSFDAIRMFNITSHPATCNIYDSGVEFIDNKDSKYSFFLTKEQLIDAKISITWLGIMKFRLNDGSKHSGFSFAPDENEEKAKKVLALIKQVFKLK